jgi:hypothetical protein
MDVRAAAGEPPSATPRGERGGLIDAPVDGATTGAIDDQARAIEGEPHQVALRRSGPAPSAGAHRYTRNQDDTSESQLMARWRSRARSPMSIPVVVAIASIGVLMRSSGE